MPGIDFDRQVFVPPVEDQPQKPPSRIVGIVILAVAVAGIAFVGYKLMFDPSLNGVSAEANSLQQIQQELADMKERLDQLDKRHKGTAVESPVATSPKTSPDSSGATTRSKPAYQISAASTLSAQRNPNPPSQPPAQRSAPAAAAATNDTADRESWQATTDRLADVVGTVGSQEGEINQTRDQLNQLLSQTRRTALQFELTRATGRQSVGPVELQLKASDSKSQRYTVCVYLNNRRVELKDRVLDEVVVFVLARGTPPLELVATRINHDRIVGYLEVPTERVLR
ncbi:MAG: hypothetical protein WAL95_09390 [Candidatus Acidiferrales bacterium]